MASKKIAVMGKNCVACGMCEKMCPIGAISIYKGMYAKVNREKCVGCGRCEKSCPAGIIDIIEREAVK